MSCSSGTRLCIRMKPAGNDHTISFCSILHNGYLGSITDGSNMITSDLFLKTTNSEIDIDHELENFDMEVDPDAWRFDVGR